ncbi:hypothetical protein SAMN02949497_1652 [Methylomagnum ishizawai]|uniref:Uncharacterized protein n=1 Tax=Methylomagnum ishizawai TaxID=1760988 RepID=A0A1Y6D196_9GAMM|nr:DUF1889 family protein [Methylomagnum ishizawai]SMF94342.1 hypothetical protein SAMN02949497_1652 [Methylomagnum ishizawai]
MQSDHEVIERAMDILTSVVNVSTGLSHPLDEARAKELFRALHRRSVDLGYQEIHDQAIKRSWPERHAAALAKLAEKIGNGGAVRIRHPRDWGEPTVDRIFSELGRA